MRSTRCLAAAALLLGPLAWTAAAQETEPSVAERMQAGRAALAAGDHEKATGLFREVTRLAPDLVPAWLGASLAAAGSGDPVGALALARRASAVAPDDASAHLAVGRLLADLGRRGPALAALAEARRLDPALAPAYHLAALLLRDGGRADEAAALLTEALGRIEAPAAEISAELAGLQLAAGEPAEALEVTAAALELHPDRGELHLARGLALVALAASPDAGDEAASLPAAAAAFEEALRHDLRQPQRAHLALAEVLLGLDRADEAVEHLERAAEFEPERPEVHYRLGAALQRTGDTAGARAALERFRRLSQEADRIDHDAKKRGAALNEAQELVATGRPEDALAKLDELLAEEPAEVRALNLKAKVLFSLGRKEEALEPVRAARARAPGVVESHVLAGMFLMDLGRDAEAEEALLEAVALEPALGDAHALLGSLAATANRPLEAIERFERALALGAEGVALRLRYAEVLHSLGRIDESKVQLEAYRALLGGAPEEPGA